MVGIGTAALVAVAAAMMRRALGAVPAETGTFANGMDYARLGDGPKTLVWIPVGLGSDVPRGTMGALSGGQFRPLLEAGFTVWFATRKRNMPTGHTVADMADDSSSTRCPAAVAQLSGAHVPEIEMRSTGTPLAGWHGPAPVCRWDCPRGVPVGDTLSGEGGSTRCSGRTKPDM